MAVKSKVSSFGLPLVYSSVVLDAVGDLQLSSSYSLLAPDVQSRIGTGIVLSLDCVTSVTLSGKRYESRLSSKHSETGKRASYNIDSALKSLLDQLHYL